MQQWSRNLAVLWVGNFLTGVGFSLVAPFLPVFLQELGVREHTETWAGAAFAITFVTSTIMAPIWGNLADRYGRKVMVMRSGIAISIVFVLMSYSATPTHLLILRALNGLFAGFIPAAAALVATNTPEARVGRSLAILGTAAAAGQVMGPGIGGALADLWGIRQSMLVAAAAVGVATVLAGLLVREQRAHLATQRTTVIQDLRTAFANPALSAVLVTVSLTMAAVFSVEPILTLYLPTLRQEAWLSTLVGRMFGPGGGSTFVSGLIFSLPALCVLLFATAWARRGERFGFPQTMSLGLLGAGLFVLPQGLAASVGQFALLRLGFGIMQSAVHPAANATIAIAVPRDFRGRAYGVIQSAFFIGAVIGPMWGGLVAGWLGPGWVFVSTGLLLVTAGLWARQRLAGALPAAEGAMQS